jgi:DNA-directed RNA polymerase alpha subunit
MSSIQSTFVAAPFSGWSAEVISKMTVQPLEETDNTFRFTLAGLNVSLANAVRRTIQDDIPCYVFDIAKCNVEINTGRLHNEILKQRLQCIPIHSKISIEDWLEKRAEHDLFEKYVMELDVQNNGDHIIYVTTADFRIKNKTSGRYLTESEMDRLFPKNKLTNSSVIFARLRPRISESVPGEHLKLSCEFAISTAAENSAFSMACCAAYGNTIDPEAADKAWEATELRLRDDAAKKNESVDATEIAFQKKNFQILDRQRHFVKDSFDFNVETTGVYDARELCKMACVHLKAQFDALALEIESDNATILNSETTMDNCFDFILEKGDYTIGKVLEYALYENGFVAKGAAEPIIQFCGFKKFHPHDTHSTIRVSYFSKDAEKGWLKTHLKESCVEAAATFKALALKF